MNCARARAAVTEARIGRPGPDSTLALSTHLERCAACRETARFESLLAAELARLRDIAPAPVRVESRILERVEAIGSVPKRALAGRQVAVLAAAASVTFLAVLAGVLRLLAPAVLGRAAGTGAALLKAAVGAGRSGATLLGTVRDLLGAGLDALVSVVSVVAHLDPALRPVAGAAIVMVLAVSAAIVARDLTRGPRLSRKEIR